MQRVDDPDDPRLDDVRHLTDAAARRAVAPGAEHGVVVVEGPLALEQLRASGLPLRSVVLTPARADTMGAGLEGVAPVYVVERDVLRQVCGYDVHRGVLASAARPSPQAPAAVLRGARRAVVLEGVSDNENVGAIARNAAALGLDALLLDAACTDPLYRRSVRVSSGWTLRLPFARGGEVGELLDSTGDAGLRRVALTPGAGAVPVDEAAARGLLDDPVAFVLGAEGPGLTPGALAACDVAVRVPMAPEVDSLNVATSLAVVAAFAAARRAWA